jgi:hypothetical protein
MSGAEPSFARRDANPVLRPLMKADRTSQPDDSTGFADKNMVWIVDKAEGGGYVCVGVCADKYCVVKNCLKPTEYAPTGSCRQTFTSHMRGALQPVAWSYLSSGARAS